MAKKLNNFVLIYNLDMEKERCALLKERNQELTTYCEQKYKDTSLEDLSSFNKSLFKSIKTFIEFLTIHSEHIPNRYNFNIFIFGDLNLLVTQNKQILADIVEKVNILQETVEERKIIIKIHFMTSTFEYIKPVVEQSTIVFEEIFTTYCNKGQTNVIFLSGHGISYQKPLLSSIHDVPDIYTMNNLQYDLDGLAYFDINSLHIKINIYYLIDKINILQHRGDKNYIIIPEICYASNFFNYLDNSSVLEKLHLTNLEGIVPTTCGKRALSESRGYKILILLLTLNNEQLTYVTANIQTADEKFEIKKFHEFEYTYEFNMKKPIEKGNLSYLDDDYVHDGFSGGYKHKYLKYKQKYLKLKMKLLQI